MSEAEGENKPKPDIEETIPNPYKDTPEKNNEAEQEEEDDELEMIR